MRRRRSNSSTAKGQAPGQDSFLDIVANLVGILIILIMAIGMRTQDAIVDAAPVTQEPPTPNVKTAKATSAALEQDIHELAATIQRGKLELQYRHHERDRVNLIKRAVEQALEQERQQLSQVQQHDYDLRSAIAGAEHELERLREAHEALDTSAPPSKVLRHLPSPMAKTVFGKEIHFRLQGGRLMHIPWDDLVEKLKAEAPNQMWKMNDKAELTETLGPLHGFWLKYTLHRKQYAVQTKVGVAQQESIELRQFLLLPVSEEVGEPLDVALRGAFPLSLLDQSDPQRTTVTVWVYPDSFEDYRRLKEYLFQRGFLCAARPMPEGQPIGGSPEGVRSSAQ